MGLFLTFEGMDGSGKTTQMKRLAERLRACGRTVLETAEPGGTPIGQQIRRILLDPANGALAPAAELLLYFAARAQNVEQWIVPALDAGQIVLSDRFTDSTLVYQGVGRGLGEEAVRTLHRIGCHGLQPDLTLFLDIDWETSLHRARNRKEGADRMEGQAAAFYQRVRGAYASLAAAESNRIRVIDARDDVEAVAGRVWKVVEPYV